MSSRAYLFIIDRGNPFSSEPGEIEHPPIGIYLYSHLDGHNWPEKLRRALHYGVTRWHDPGYLTRILISQMYMDMHEDLRGGAVSTTRDNHITHYPDIIVDIPRQTVQWAADLHTYQNYTFDEYTRRVSAQYHTQ
jgi:hypothetical protein